jgi:hypothetical protein
VIHMAAYARYVPPIPRSLRAPAGPYARASEKLSGVTAVLFASVDATAVPEPGDDEGPAALEVPAADPIGALRRLEALIEGHAADEPLGVDAWPDHPSGPVFGVPESFVVAITGADGDPEMEWDDLATQWVAEPEVDGAVSAEEAEYFFDDLRALCGELADGERVYLALELAPA